MITMWHSVEGQASCTDERYLLIINFLCTTWPKLIGGGEFKHKADFNLLIIIIFYKNLSKVIKDGEFEPETNMNYLII